MKKYLPSLIVGMAIIGFFTLSPSTASAHGFVPHFKALSVTDVTADSAVLTGTVDSMHSSFDGHAWFEYGTNPHSGNFGNSWPFKAGIRGIPWIGVTDMRTQITGLKPNTTYFFTMNAENKNGKNVSEVMSFTTKGVARITSACTSNCYTYNPNPCTTCGSHVDTPCDSCGSSVQQSQWLDYQYNYNINNISNVSTQVNNNQKYYYSNQNKSYPCSTSCCTTSCCSTSCYQTTSPCNCYQNQPYPSSSYNVYPSNGYNTYPSGQYPNSYDPYNQNDQYNNNQSDQQNEYDSPITAAGRRYLSQFWNS